MGRPRKNPLPPVEELPPAETDKDTATDAPVATPVVQDEEVIDDSPALKGGRVVQYGTETVTLYGDEPVQDPTLGEFTPAWIEWKSKQKKG